MSINKKRNLFKCAALALCLLAAFALIIAGCDNGSSGDAVEAARSTRLAKVSLTVGGDAQGMAQKSISVGGLDWSSLTYKYKAVPQWTANNIQGAVTTWTNLPGNNPGTYSDGMSLGYFTPGQWVFHIQILNGSTPIYQGNSAVYSISSSGVAITVPVSKIVTEAQDGSVQITVTAATQENDSLTISYTGTASGSNITADASRSGGITTFSKTISSLGAGTYEFTLTHSNGTTGAVVGVDLTAGQTATIEGTLNNGIWQVGLVTLTVHSITVSPAPSNGTIYPDVAGAAPGDKVVLYVEPDDGYILSTISVNSGAVSTTDISDANGVAYTFTMPDADVTVTAAFTGAPVNTITVNTASHGSVTASKASGTAGEQIYLVVEPDDGYGLTSITVAGTSCNVETTAINAGTYKFTMPDESVTVTPVFAVSSSHIIYFSSVSGGSVRANKVSAESGTTVTLTTVPSSGNGISSLTVTGNSAISLNEEVRTELNTYTFSMPNTDVTVAATFGTAYSITGTGSTAGGSVVADRSTACAGETVTLTTATNSGYRFGGVTYNGNATAEVAAGTTYTFTMPNANVTVAAVFNQLYSITKNSMTNGSVTLAKTEAISGETVTLTIQPDDGYQLASISTSNGNLTGSGTASGSTRTLTMAAANAVISASFEKVTYTISGTGSVTGGSTSYSGTPQIGNTITLTATPSTGYQLASISATDSTGALSLTTTGTNTRTFTMRSSNVTVSASFEKITYTVTLDQQDHGTLSYSGTPQMGNTITITAGSLDSSYTLASVAVQDTTNSTSVTPSAVSDNSCTFVMPAGNVTVTPTYTSGYSVTVGSLSNGSATVQTASAAAASSLSNITAGTAVTINLTPSTGYQVSTVTVKDGSNNSVTVNGSGNTRTFTMPSSAATVSATFTKVTYTITKGSMTNGDVSYSGTAQYGNTITVTVNPNSGYELNALTVNNGSVSTNASVAGRTYTFSMPAANVTINATFKAHTLSYVEGVASLAVGDVVLQNGKYVSKANFLKSPKSYVSASAPAGVVAYTGTTDTIGTTGKVYMVGLNQGSSLKWAPSGTTGYTTTFSTSLTAGERNWAVITAADAAGVESAATNYPAFNYANTYSVTGYTSGWFLPAKAELSKLYTNRTTINNTINAITGAGGTATALPSSGSVWSSSQTYYYNNAWTVNFTNGDTNYSAKDYNGYVRVVRALN